MLSYMLYRQHGALGSSIEHFYMKHAVVSLTRLACRCTIWHKCIDAGGGSLGKVMYMSLTEGVLATVYTLHMGTHKGISVDRQTLCST